MNSENSHFEFDPEAMRAACSDLPFLQRVVRYQDGTLTSDETTAFEQELLTNSDKLRVFADLQMQSAAIHSLLRHRAYAIQETLPVVKTDPSCSIQRTSGWAYWSIGAALAICTVAAMGGGWIAATQWRGDTQPIVVEQSPAPAVVPQEADVPAKVVMPVEELNVLLTGSSRAKFFGELNPKVRSPLAVHRDYVLIEGLVELSFPTGASAIIEAPAVFRVMANDCLAMDTGRCSVHAPDGAEGFRVETPVTRVVDRGTRFTVNVTEGIETEVQVIEGIADVYWKAETSSDSPETSAITLDAKEKLPLQMRLEQQDAQRFSGTQVATSVPVEFTPRHYRSVLPDRIVSYEATTIADRGVENLLNITVKRNGVAEKYEVDELIPTELIWFKSYTAVDRTGHLTGGNSLPEHRRDLLGDASLSTGIINPGGQVEPLMSAPVMQTPEDPLHPNTPGFAVRFRSPVVNGPGPDVVFFELQTYSNPPDGDAFHVSPMTFENGRRSLTVHTYDLTLVSPEALTLNHFYVYQFAAPVGSLQELEELTCIRTRVRTGFRALAVGIDLSNLGYAKDESVQELFFQDANDDEKNIVDPVFIAGLPGSRTLALQPGKERAHHEK